MLGHLSLANESEATASEAGDRQWEEEKNCIVPKPASKLTQQRSDGPSNQANWRFNNRQKTQQHSDGMELERRGGLRSSDRPSRTSSRRGAGMNTGTSARSGTGAPSASSTRSPRPSKPIFPGRALWEKGRRDCKRARSSSSAVTTDEGDERSCSTEDCSEEEEHEDDEDDEAVEGGEEKDVEEEGFQLDPNIIAEVKKRKGRKEEEEEEEVGKEDEGKVSSSTEDCIWEEEVEKVAHDDGTEVSEYEQLRCELASNTSGRNRPTRTEDAPFVIASHKVIVRGQPFLLSCGKVGKMKRAVEFLQDR